MWGTGWANELFIGWAQQALNRALILDPATRDDLLALLDRPLCARVDPPGLRVQVEAHGQELRLTTQSQQPGALTLSGSALAFATLLMGDRSVFSQGRIQVEGDVSLAQQLQRLLERLDPDWEAVLAERVGDVPAHFIGKRVREAIQWSRRAHQSLLANIDEYLHEETHTLPPRAQLEAHFGDIDALRLAVDRIEARTERLEAAQPQRQEQ